MATRQRFSTPHVDSILSKIIDKMRNFLNN
jgi:hypothetical protein